MKAAAGFQQHARRYKSTGGLSRWPRQRGLSMGHTSQRLAAWKVTSPRRAFLGSSAGVGDHYGVLSQIAVTLPVLGSSSQSTRVPLVRTARVSAPPPNPPSPLNLVLTVQVLRPSA